MESLLDVGRHSTRWTLSFNTDRDYKIKYPKQCPVALLERKKLRKKAITSHNFRDNIVLIKRFEWPNRIKNIVRMKSSYKKKT